MSHPRFNLRAFTSFTLLVGGVVVAAAGVVLYVAPSGRVANLIDWQFLGLSRPDWQAIRTIFALLFLIAAPIHLYLNWRVFWSYLRDRAPTSVSRRWELAASVVLVTLIFVFTLRGATPFSAVIAFGERVSASWPVPEHVAEASQAGAQVSSGSSRETRAPSDSPLAAQPATDSAVETGEVDTTATDRPTPGTGTGTGGGTGTGASPGAGTGDGFGRMTLEEFCKQEGIPLTEAISRLEAAGITARGSDRLRTLAVGAGRQPNEVADLVRG